MRRIGAMIFVAALGSISAGCGTMANMDGRDTLIGLPSRPPTPFGGLANDMAWMSGKASLEEGKKYDRDFSFVVGFSDLPFSMVGDVATLPWTTYESLREGLFPSDRYDKEKYKRELDKATGKTKTPAPQDDD